MIHGKVINADPRLVGKTALLKLHPNPDMYWVQFDDLTLEYNGVMLASGWHEMMTDAFEEADQ